MNSIEINIGNSRYVVKSEESEEHLREVAEMVRRRVEGVKKKVSSLNYQKASILAAFDLASEVIKSRRKSSDYRSNVLSKAQSILEKVEMQVEA